MILESTDGRESADGSSSGGAGLQECLRGHSSKPTGICDPTQTAAVAADDGVKERHVRKENRPKEGYRVVSSQDQGWANCLSGRAKMGPTVRQRGRRSSR